LGAALRRLPAEVSAALTTKLQEHVVTAFAEFVKGQSQQLIAASDDTADGITLKFTIAGLAGLQQIGRAMLPNGQTAGVAETILRGAKPEVRVEAQPGFTR
jgi:hypothetical protein